MSSIPPTINDDSVASCLRDLRKDMSILQMERLSGVDRQVLYRIMGGSSVNRSPYELVIKVLTFIQNYCPDGALKSPDTSYVTEMTKMVAQSQKA